MIADARTLRTLAEDPESLLRYLGGLSNAQFRRASAELGERILTEVDTDCFWSVFRALMLHDRRAYLGTLLKALSARLTSAPRSVGNGGEASGILWDGTFAELCTEMTETDRRKVLFAILPLMPSPADAERLLRLCGLHESSTWIPFLLQVRTAPCAFLLLKALRYVEHDRALLIRTCHFLMKAGDALSFNLAALLRTYFALEEVRGTFSLSLKPYQLARIEQSYDAFLQAIRF